MAYLMKWTDPSHIIIWNPAGWALPNRYEEAMKAIHEARPIVTRGNSDLGRAYREFGKKFGLEPQAAPALQKKLNCSGGL